MLSTHKEHRSKFTPLGVIGGLIGVALFAYFIKRAGVGQIMDGISHLGAGFLLIVGISAVRQVVRSYAWVLCMAGPERLRFWDALRVCVMWCAMYSALAVVCGVASLSQCGVFLAWRLRSDCDSGMHFARA